MNKMKSFRRLIGSVENAVAQPEVVTQLSPEEQINQAIDLQNAEHQLDATSVEFDRAIDTEAQLTDLATSLESFAQTNGMTPSEYGLTQQALRAITRGTPINAAGPALESFDTAAMRLNNAQVALESVNEKLTAAAQWIKKVLGALAKALIEGIAKTIAALNSFGHNLDRIEWPKLWDDAEYLYIPASIFWGFGIAPADATFESIERIMQHHADYASFFESKLVPGLIQLTDRALEDYKHKAAHPGLSNSSSELYDEMVTNGRTTFNETIKGFFGDMSEGEVPDEKDFYHQIRTGKMLPGGYRWIKNAHGRPEFENALLSRHLDRILWADKPSTVKVKVPDQKQAEDLLHLAIRANNQIASGVKELDRVAKDLNDVADNIDGTAIGGNDAAIQLRTFMVEFTFAFRGMSITHANYTHKVTSGLIKFFRSKAEDSEHA